MADLPEVTQRFVADVREYLAALRDATSQARDFARANLEAAAAIKTMQAAASGDARDLADIASAAAGAASAEADMRTTAAEAALALRLQAGAAESAATATAGLAAADTAAAAAGGSGFLASLTGSAGVLAIVAGAVAALGTGLTGIIPAIAAAALGLGSFGILALGTFKDVISTLSTLNTDTAAYQAAVGDVAKDQALAKIRADWQAIDPAQRQAVRGIQQVQAEFSKLAQQFEPVVMPIFNQLLDIAKTLMPLLIPLANSAAAAIGQLLGQFDKFAKSQGFQDFVFQMSKLAGPAIETIGTALGRIMIAVGRLLEAMANPDALRIFKGLMDGLAMAITGLAVAFTVVTADAVRFYHDIAVAFDKIRHIVSSFGHDFKLDFHDVAHVFDDIRHAVASFASFWAAQFDGARHTVAAFGHDLAASFDAWRHLFASLGAFIAHFFLSDIPNWINAGVRFFQQLPGRILAAVASFPSLLFAAGRALIQGLINGIQSMIGSLLSLVGSIAGMISRIKGPLDYDRQLLVPHGQAIMHGLMAGIGSQIPALAAQMRAVTSIAGVPYGGGLAFPGAGAGGAPAAAGGAPAVSVSVTVHGSVIAQQDLRAAIQQAVLDAWTRNRGTGFAPYGYGVR